MAGQNFRTFCSLVSAETETDNPRVNTETHFINIVIYEKKRNKDVCFTVIQMLIQALFDQKLLLGTAICWAIIWVPKDEKGSAQIWTNLTTKFVPVLSVAKWTTLD